MKRILFAILISALLIGIGLDAEAQTKFRAYTALTGGGTGALDKTSVADLANNDIAFVGTSSGFYVFIFNSASTAAENSPWYIRPNDYSTAGVWVCINLVGPAIDVAPVDDGYIAFTPSTSGESQWWIGPNHDSGGDDDDPLEVRQSATPGTNVRWRINKDGSITFYGNINLANGEQIKNGTNGRIDLAGAGGTNNEDLTLDFESTANEVAIGTTTGATQLRMVQGMMFGANINLVTKTSGATLAVNEMNGIVFMTGAGTIVLPEIVASSPSSSQVTPGACVCVVNRDDNEQIVIDPNANDSITLDGTKDTAGDSIQNTVTASTGGGDFACVVAVEADNWMVMGKSGTWTAN